MALNVKQIQEAARRKARQTDRAMGVTPSAGGEGGGPLETAAPTASGAMTAIQTQALSKAREQDKAMGVTPEKRFVPMPGSGLESGSPFPSAGGLLKGELPTLGTAGTGMDRITGAYLKQREKEARAAQVIPLPTPTGPSTPSTESTQMPPYIMGRDAVPTAMSYAAGLQAKQTAQAIPKDKEYAAADWSPGKSVVSALRKGAGMVAQAGADTLAFAEDIAAAPFEFVGQQPFGELSDTMPFNRIAAKIREEQERTAEYYRENMEKGGTLAEGIENLGAATVAAVPQAVIAMLTGGGSMAAQTTAGVAQASEAALSPGVATTVRHVVERMAQDPQYWLSFAHVVGSGYESALADQREMEEEKKEQAGLAGAAYIPPENENGMRAKAALYAVGNGLLNAAVEVGGGIQTLPAQLQGGQRAWRAWVDSMLDEGKEEAIQGVIERGLQGIYGKWNPIFSITDENAIINPVTAGKEYAGGAIVGGILGGGQIGLNQLIQSSAKQI